MIISSRLLLIGASGLAAQPLPPTMIPSEYSFLYAATDRGCMALAGRVGDQLWLAPRRQPGLDSPDMWRELLHSHRYHGVIGIVPEAALAAGLETARAATAGALHMDQKWRTLELSLPATLL
jgi:hypothetical protein